MCDCEIFDMRDDVPKAVVGAIGTWRYAREGRRRSNFLLLWSMMWRHWRAGTDAERGETIEEKTGDYSPARRRLGEVYSGSRDQMTPTHYRTTSN